jgi:hypothetical protein
MIGRYPGRRTSAWAAAAFRASAAMRIGPQRNPVGPMLRCRSGDS